jgi:TatA/E family protein of Tat protein translocase
MFGSIGPTEIILIFIIALLVFGPKKLPEVGKSVGKAIREFKKASDEIKGRIEEEIQASEIKDIHKDIKSGLDTLQSGARGFQDRLKQTMGLDDLAKSPPAAETSSAAATPYDTAPEIPTAAENPASDPESSSNGRGTDPYATLKGKETRQDIPPEPGRRKGKIKKDSTKNETGEGTKVS